MSTQEIQGELVASDSGAPLVAQSDEALMGVSLDLMKARVQKIHSVMKDVMKKDQHYGVIPGTGKKPTLLQPGAQMLCTMFRLTPKPEIKLRHLEGGHREYEVVCQMFGPNGNPLGFGVGLCSTMETRYRYRMEKGTMKVVGEVPKAYWGLRDKEPDKAQAMIGPGNKTKKLDDGTWAIVHYEGGGGKVENPDIADVYNTVLKIASKRALVSATLNVTGASDVFTQDLEDMEATIRDTGSRIKPKGQKPEQTEGGEDPDRWSNEQLDVVKQIREATPDWIKDTSVAAKKLTADLAAVEKSDDLEPIQAVFDKWVNGIFPDLETIKTFADHPEFDAKKDKKKLQEKMAAADYDAEQLHAVVEIWTELLDNRAKKKAALKDEAAGPAVTDENGDDVEGEAVDLNNPDD